MPENRPTELSDLKTEVTRLRQALWDVLVAVDELAYVVEFSREQELGTKSVVEAIDRARDILSKEQLPTTRPRGEKMRR